MTLETKVLEFNNNPAAEKQPQGDLIFSLDIGTRTVVALLGEQREDELVLIDYVVVPHTKRAMKDGQIEDIKQVGKIAAKARDDLSDKTGIELKKVGIAAAGRALKTVRVTMEFDVSERDSITEEMIKSMEIETVQKAQAILDNEEAEKSSNFDKSDTPFYSEGAGNAVTNTTALFYCVGYSVVNYFLDKTKILNLEAHKGRIVEIELIATFLPNIVVEGLYTVMDNCGLEVKSLTLEPIAAMNVIVPAEIRLINIALVDIGAGTSDIAISRDGSIVAYAMATIAGDEITESIIREFFVDFTTAENMKFTSTSGEEIIEYRDIFGIKQEITTEDFLKKIDNAVELLAETICANITEANSGAPMAVFLVGGGSLITGLSKKVADKLKISPSRVKIGDYETFRGTDLGGRKMGAEFVTPLGIGVTAIQSQGYDFSVITLNDKKIRVFDTRKLSIFDLLTMSGYKTSDIMGRSGRSLTFSVGGRHRTVKGGIATPAEITVNGKSVSLNSPVTQGDRVIFKPAISGENASACIEDVFDIPTHGTVRFAGETYNLGVEFYVNDTRVSRVYNIQPLDKIEIAGIATLEDLLNSIGENPDQDDYLINGDYSPKTTVLHDGDIITCARYALEGNKGTYAEKFLSNKDNAENSFVSISESEKEKSEITEKERALSEEITVTFNGKEVKLPANKSGEPHLYVELMNYAEFSRTSPPSNYEIKLNGLEANFNTELKDGDKAELITDTLLMPSFAEVSEKPAVKDEPVEENNSVQDNSAENETVQNVSAENETMQNVSAENETAQNVSAENETVQNVSAENETVQNVSAENETVQNVSAENEIAQNVSAENDTVQNVSAENDNVQNVSAENEWADLILSPVTAGFTSEPKLSAEIDVAPIAEPDEETGETDKILHGGEIKDFVNTVYTEE
jgi:cell division ATPase FtsA